MDANDRVMRFPEVAEFLAVSTQTVYNLADAGLLPSFRIGGTRMRRVWLSDLKRYIGCPIPTVSNGSNLANQSENNG